MKIHILFQFKEASGGGNQFLKALRDQFRSIGCYAESLAEADGILLNSYQYVEEAVAAKKRYPEKLFIHRIDGPIRLYNRLSDQRDGVTNAVNAMLADGTVFQSEWSRQMNVQMGLAPNCHQITIGNAPNPEWFNRIGGPTGLVMDGKVRLIATSWSSNPKKGFDTYQWLDRHLDFSKYSMTFVGNTPLRFNNIIHKPALSSAELARELKAHDVFITASQSDPCSNSLIEALHCGLPALALYDGGHPELLNKGGLTFHKPEAIPELLATLTRDYASFQSGINVPTLSEIAERYLVFFQDIEQATIAGRYMSKQVTIVSRAQISWQLLHWKLRESLDRRLNTGVAA